MITFDHQFVLHDNVNLLCSSITEPVTSMQELVDTWIKCDVECPYQANDSEVKKANRDMRTYTCYIVHLCSIAL